MNHSKIGLSAAQQQAAEEVKKQREFYQTAREVCRDLFAIRPSVYWIDFSLSIVAAYVMASVFLALPIVSPIAWTCFFAGGLLIYRASMFIHEIVHLPSNELKGFRRFWNLFAGVPLMVPLSLIHI